MPGERTTPVGVSKTPAKTSAPGPWPLAPRPLAPGPRPPAPGPRPPTPPRFRSRGLNTLRYHLAALPVKARRSTLLYRDGKFLRRHRESVAAVLLAAALMAGFSLWQTRRAAKPRAVEPPNIPPLVRQRPSVGC